MSESAIQIGKEEFEALLQGLGKAVERFVKYKISPVEDAEDILQEIYLYQTMLFEITYHKKSFHILPDDL